MNGGTRKRKTISRKRNRGGGMFDSVTSGFGSMFSSKSEGKDKEENSASTAEVLDDVTSGAASVGGSRRRRTGRKSRRTGRKSRRTGRKSKRAGRKSKRTGRKSKRTGRKSKRAGRKSKRAGRKSKRAGRKSKRAGRKSRR